MLGAAGANRDLDILQSPVFEAFTNNTSTMKSKLLTIANNNLLYLPVKKLNQVAGPQLMKTTGDSTFQILTELFCCLLILPPALSLALR